MFKNMVRKHREKQMDRIFQKKMDQANDLVRMMLAAPEDERPIYEMMLARNHVTTALMLLDRKFDSLLMEENNREKALAFARAAEKLMSEFEYELMAFTLCRGEVEEACDE